MNLIEGLSSKLVDHWTLLAPSFVFWTEGLTIWVWHYGWTPLGTWLTTQSIVVQLALLGGALLVVVASAVVVKHFDLAVLRFLEGYWPRWLQCLRMLWIGRVKSGVGRVDERIQKLGVRGLQDLSLEERDEFFRLDQWRRLHIPPLPAQLMPTRLGNIIRAAELRPKDKYGLDAVVCWPRLWLLLPGDVKQELAYVQAALNTAVRLYLWSLLFLIWIIWPWVRWGWSWWLLLIPVVSLLTILFASHRALSLAEIHSDLLDSTFDLYRMALYKSLRWPLPENPQSERKVGAEITNYLWRGSDSSSPNFVPTEK